jgi:hypothetical protein
VLYHDGIAVATWVAGKLAFLVDTTLDDQRAWRRALLREPEPTFHPA